MSKIEEQFEQALTMVSNAFKEAEDLFEEGHIETSLCLIDAVQGALSEVSRAAYGAWDVRLANKIMDGILLKMRIREVQKKLEASKGVIGIC